jgi:hypothetical protein
MQIGLYCWCVKRTSGGGGDLQKDQTCGLWCCQMQALFVNMDTYLQGLFSLANDSAAEVRKLVSKLWYKMSDGFCWQVVWEFHKVYGLCKVEEFL